MFPPLLSPDFYPELQQIALSRCTVLAEIEQMPTKELPKLDVAVKTCPDILLSSPEILRACLKIS